MDHQYRNMYGSGRPHCTDRLCKKHVRIIKYNICLQNNGNDSSTIWSVLRVPQWSPRSHEYSFVSSILSTIGKNCSETTALFNDMKHKNSMHNPKYRTHLLIYSLVLSCSLTSSACFTKARDATLARKASPTAVVWTRNLSMLAPSAAEDRKFCIRPLHRQEKTQNIFLDSIYHHL